MSTSKQTVDDAIRYDRTLDGHAEARLMSAFDVGILSAWRPKEEPEMGWIVLTLVGAGLCFLIALTLVRLGRDSDRAARRAHQDLHPFAEATTTRGS